MEKENLKNQDEKKEGMCQKCGEEPVFMNGLCVYCYEEEVYEQKVPTEKPKNSEMVMHGMGLKNPNQQKVLKERAIKKAVNIKNRKKRSKD